MYIYGLDLSIANTGVVIMNKDKEIIFLDSVTTPSKQPMGVRLHIIREYFKELIEKYPPKVVCIERGFTRFNNVTQILFRVHGVINELFYEYKQIYYAPTSIKKKLTGNGKAKKKQVLDAVKELYKDIDIKNYDEADAIGIALMYFK